MRIKKQPLAAMRVLSTPLAYRVVATIGMRGPQTTCQLARLLGKVPISSLYRQLALLRGAGLLRVASERRARGAVERTYALASRQAAAFKASDLARVPTSQLRATLQNFIGMMTADLSAYVENRAFVRSRLLVGAALHICKLRDDEYVEAVRAIHAAIRRSKAKSRGGPSAKRRYFYLVTLPDMVGP
jgi:DNA-binding transcriptional ArsR family regulator